MCKIVLIAAIDKETGIIGIGKNIPWKHRQDLIYFKNQTINKPVIMGRITAEALQKKLEKRINIVVTKKKNFNIKGMLKAENIEIAIKIAKQYCGTKIKEIMIIGGGEIFCQTVDIADKILLTYISKTEKLAKNYPKDEKKIFFPLPLASYWKITSKKLAQASPKDDCNAVFYVYEKDEKDKK